MGEARETVLWWDAVRGQTTAWATLCWFADNVKFLMWEGGEGERAPVYFMRRLSGVILFKYCVLQDSVDLWCSLEEAGVAFPVKLASAVCCMHRHSPVSPPALIYSLPYSCSFCLSLNLLLVSGDFLVGFRFLLMRLAQQSSTEEILPLFSHPLVMITFDSDEGQLQPVSPDPQKWFHFFGI